MRAERARKRILIIEDDENARDMMADVLSAAGYYVAGQDHSEHAVESVRAQTPDLLILDLMMPEMDGIQVLAQVKALGYTLPVLIVTASPVERIEGADAMLHKPFDVADLEQAVAALIGPSGGPRPPHAPTVAEATATLQTAIVQETASQVAAAVANAAADAAVEAAESVADAAVEAAASYQPDAAKAE